MNQSEQLDFKELNNRYNNLSETSCCLSCGGAINYAAVKNGEICIDLGSGRGTDVIRLAEMAGSEGHAYGIDISDGMIRKSSNTASMLGIANVNFIKSPLEDISLKNEIADVIISNCTINHSTDKQQVWNEIYRLLKKGGRFIISDIYAMNPVPEIFRNDPVAVAECWAGAVTRNEYLEHIRRAGFSATVILEESKPYEKGSIMVSSWTIAGNK
jgi:ubiquinone/menaquinone biosynthesis C-methylase UbiE